MSAKKIKPQVQQKIVPVITPSVQTTSVFEPKPGEYHMARLDANGVEIPGSDFSIAHNTFKKTYEPLTQGDNPTYLLKKNPK